MPRATARHSLRASKIVNKSRVNGWTPRQFFDDDAHVAADLLTDDQVQTLKRQLLKKGAEINEKLTRLLNGQKVDMAALLGAAKPGESPIERLRRFLTLVDGRIQAIRAGRYGRCESCGAPLPFDHLQQIPWIDTCADCARKPD
jgi:RNA polymerase-binding transcription factor DksA